MLRPGIFNCLLLLPLAWASGEVSAASNATEANIDAAAAAAAAGGTVTENLPEGTTMTIDFPGNASRGHHRHEEEETPKHMIMVSKDVVASGSFVAPAASHPTTRCASDLVQPVSFAFLVSLVVATLLEKAHVSFLPESAVVICVGVALGWGLKFMKDFPVTLLHELNAPVVNMLLLPLIIFESGWSLRSYDFAAQFVYILFFAVVGTFIAMFVVGYLIYWTGPYHGITDMRTAFTYASLIAATDPVATLATYSSLRVEPLLHILVFGESTVNDAVAIVVFDILNGDELFGPVDAQEMPSSPRVWSSIWSGIAVKLLGSMSVGFAFAVGYTLILKFAHMKHSQSMEILFIVFSCYLTFSSAEIVGMSGIIAVLFCSILMGIYAKPHLSKEGQGLASFFVKELAQLADMGIFLLVGMDFVITSSTSIHFSSWVILFLLVGRAVATFPMGFLVNCIKRASAGRSGRTPMLLSARHLFMMWHAGLRGGIALVLVLEMGDWVDVNNKPGTKQTLLNTTVVVIVVFLLIFGGSTECALKALGIQTGVEEEERYLYDRSLLNCTHDAFRAVDAWVMRPMLGTPDEDAGPEDENRAKVGAIDAVVAKRNTHRGHQWFASRQASGQADASDSDDSGDDSEAK